MTLPCDHLSLINCFPAVNGVIESIIMSDMPVLLQYQYTVCCDIHHTVNFLKYEMRQCGLNKIAQQVCFWRVVRVQIRYNIVGCFITYNILYEYDYAGMIIWLTALLRGHSTRRLNGLLLIAALPGCGSQKYNVQAENTFRRVSGWEHPIVLMVLPPQLQLALRNGCLYSSLCENWLFLLW